MKKQEIKHIDLSGIKDPLFLKDLTYPELDVLSDDIKDYILNITSTNGGHLSSNLGVIDATIALCRCFDFTKDKLIFDVGHQCYTYKLLTGRDLTKLRTTNGISGFPKMNESVYDHYETGHSSTSISAANGMAIARDLKQEKYDVIAFIGDASIVNGLAVEGLNIIGSGHHKVIVVLNDNNMAISKPVGAMAKMFRNFVSTSFYQGSKHRIQHLFETSRFGRFLLRGMIRFKNFLKRRILALTVFDLLGYKVIGPIDGHNIKGLEKAFKKAKALDKSVIVHIKTKKGKGYPYAEKDSSGEWHGVSMFNVSTGVQNKKDGAITWSERYEGLIANAMANNSQVVTIVPGTSVGSALCPLFKQYPGRMIDVGIAEEHMLVMATSLALDGFHPILSVYSTFLQRGYDQVSHDLARLNANVTLLIDRAGLVGLDGETHQGIYDEHFLYGIPNTTIAMASRPSEAIGLFNESFNKHGVFAIRYPREDIVLDDKEKTPIPYGTWKVEYLGERTAIVSVGPMTIVLKHKLHELQKNATLINAIYQKPMDEAKIRDLLKYEQIIIYDAYAIRDGFANNLAARLCELGYQGKLVIKALPDAFIKQGRISEQRANYGLSIDDIINEIL